MFLPSDTRLPDCARIIRLAELRSRASGKKYGRSGVILGIRSRRGTTSWRFPGCLGIKAGPYQVDSASFRHNWQTYCPKLHIEPLECCSVCCQVVLRRAWHSVSVSSVRGSKVSKTLAIYGRVLHLVPLLKPETSRNLVWDQLNFTYQFHLLAKREKSAMMHGA